MATETAWREVTEAEIDEIMAKRPSVMPKPTPNASFKREFTTGFMAAGALVLLALLILALCTRWADDHREPNHGVDVQIGTACVVTRGEPVACA